MNDDIRRRVGGPRNALYLADEHDGCDEAGCMHLLGADAPEDVDVLFVTFTKSIGERLAAWKRHAEAPPANVGVVAVETGGSGGDESFGDGGPTVRRVSDPSDLTGVGIAVAEFLSAWADDGNRTVVCFDSLTALLQYFEPRQVFQFANELTSKFEQAGAEAHFHITPEAHDRQVLSVLASLFDDRVGAADLGYRPSEGGTDEGDAGADDTDNATVDDERHARADEPDAASTDVAADADDGDTGVREPPGPQPDEDPKSDTGSRADRSITEAASEDGFVYAGDEFSTEATAEPAEPPPIEGDFTRGGSGGNGSPRGTGRGDDGDGSNGEESTQAESKGGEETDTEVGGEDGDESTEGGPVDERVGTGPVDESAAGETDSSESTLAPSSEAEASAETSESPTDQGDSEPDGTAGDPERDEVAAGIGGDDEPDARHRQGDDDPSGSDALVPRTTAAVVGVVAMLVLMSFFAAAIPVPFAPDSQADEGDTTADTATPAGAAAGSDDGESGGTTETSTRTETVTSTATETSTATPTPDSSSTSSGDGSSSTSGGSTGTSTPADSTTATPTSTPEDDDCLIDIGLGC